MNGKIVAGGLVVSSILFGIGLWYATNHAYYKPIEENTTQANISLVNYQGIQENVLASDFEGIDGEMSPLKFRACFKTPLSLAMMTETFEIYENPVPINAPGWFECFDAQQIGLDLENGTAFAFLSEANFQYGFDRVAAIYPDGRGYSWTQINECGLADAEGDPLPAHCPPAPEGN